MVRQMYKGGVDKTGWCETRVLPDNYFRVKNTTSSLDKFNDWLPNPINVGLFWKLCTVFEKDVGSQDFTKLRVRDFPLWFQRFYIF